MAKKVLLFLTGGLLGAILAAVLISREHAGDAARRARELDAWQVEKSRLESLLARPQPPVQKPVTPLPEALAAVPRSPQEILAELRTLKISRTSGVARGRRALKLFEELVERGQTALPAIHGFLARFEDVDYELDAAMVAKGADGKGKEKDKGKAKDVVLLSTDFIVPPSLRFGLFDVVRRIGGEQAVQILAEMLVATGRGAEVYYFARVLDQMAPGKYRDTSVQTAREFLLAPLPASSRGPLDQNDRNYLYAVLAFFKDTSLLTLARTQLIQPDGTLDPQALRFLGDTLKAESLPALGEAMFDPRLATEPKQKEDLFKEALSFAGADPRADELLARTVIADDLPLKLREKSLRDLDKHGFENPDNLTLRDLQIIQARLALLDTLGPGLREPQLVEAWRKTRAELLAYINDPDHKTNKKKK